ncbi:hypothetical protein FA09DRAFT_328273 [Tilletiopsis washingtonensis]|jgi:ADP-ribose pyrophosphatase YjhB (NUDIX family)|uniref:Uncharacterized protein n=1 Tax=Tilletiopsis washingtonensis TaxID=58919 RepID=A0A316ZEJ9_9BASI|nr:hypothetical protein FA09DRAFT_328273 [Tilletiopsis washingtonensis]PWO00171.1 hypothetical protein FA09DRAFT_328273 [Tilletiopsis washingtonensis]
MSAPHGGTPSSALLSNQMELMTSMHDHAPREPSQLGKAEHLALRRTDNMLWELKAAVLQPSPASARAQEANNVCLWLATDAGLHPEWGRTNLRAALRFMAEQTRIQYVALECLKAFADDQAEVLHICWTFYMDLAHLLDGFNSEISMELRLMAAQCEAQQDEPLDNPALRVSASSELAIELAEQLEHDVLHPEDAWEDVESEESADETEENEIEEEGSEISEGNSEGESDESSDGGEDGD